MGHGDAAKHLGSVSKCQDAAMGDRLWEEAAEGVGVIGVGVEGRDVGGGFVGTGGGELGNGGVKGREDLFAGGFIEGDGADGGHDDGLGGIEQAGGDGAQLARGGFADEGAEGDGMVEIGAGGEVVELLVDRGGPVPGAGEAPESLAHLEAGEAHGGGEAVGGEEVAEVGKLVNVAVAGGAEGDAGGDAVGGGDGGEKELLDEGGDLVGGFEMAGSGELFDAEGIGVAAGRLGSLCKLDESQDVHVARSSVWQKDLVFLQSPW